MGEAGTAVLFPGQGSQHDRMRELVDAEAPELAQLVAELLGDDPFDRLQDGTRWVQPAVFLTSVAGWRATDQSAHDVVGMAGHSLGEFAALVAGGALDADEAARLVVHRAMITEDVARNVGGGMLALLGVDRDEACALASEWGLHVANDNCPGQTVLSGSERSILAAESGAATRGLTVRRIAVAGPFHSPLMGPAVERFREALNTVAFRPPSIPVVSCITAAPFDDPRAQLAEALTHPVRWHETTRALSELGARRFVEIAPGKILTGLVRRSLRSERPILVAMDEAK